MRIILVLITATFLATAVGAVHADDSGRIARSVPGENQTPSTIEQKQKGEPTEAQRNSRAVETKIQSLVARLTQAEAELKQRLEKAEQVRARGISVGSRLLLRQAEQIEHQAFANYGNCVKALEQFRPQLEVEKLAKAESKSRQSNSRDRDGMLVKV